MQHSRNQATLLLLSIFLLAGCASTKKVPMEELADAVHPLTGTWAYSLDTPQGVYTGNMEFNMVGETLTGTITSDDMPDQPAPLEDLIFDEENSKLTFKFDGGEFGTLSVNTVLAEEKLDGLMTIGAYGVDVPMTASRKMP